MNSKQLKNIVIVAVVVIIIVLSLTGVNLINGNSNTQRKNLNIDSEAITKIVFDKAEGKSVTLNKGESGWQINDFVADDEAIDSFLSELEEGEFVSTASTNDSNYELFLVRDEDNRSASLFEGDKEVLTMVIGKNASASSTYLRLVEDKNVYVFNKYFEDIAGKTAEDFISKSLSQGTYENVSKAKTSKITLIKENGNFKVENSEESLNADKTKEFVNSLSNLKGTQYQSEDKTKGLNTSNKIEVTLDNGNKFDYEIFHKGEEYYAKRLKDNAVFTITQSEFNNLNKELKDLK